VGGILAAHTVLTESRPARPVDAAWQDRPTSLARRP
jgi:hypothetical protein